MNKTQLIILWIGAFVFLFCLWNPEIFGQPFFEYGSDAQLLRLTSITVLTVLLVYSYSDKNKTKFKEILQQLAGLKPKSGDVAKKGK